MAVAGIAVGLVAPALAGAEPRRERVETIAKGLDNPRGLAFLPSGRLAVAEAGHAGDVCLGPGFCLGLTGRVSAVAPRDGRITLADGQPSEGGPFASFGLGGVAVRDGRLYFLVGFNPQTFGNPSDDCQGQSDFNRCVAVVSAVQERSGFLNRARSSTSNHGWERLASVGRVDFDYAAAHPDPGNPEYAPGDANPFGLTVGPSGGFYVVDAASNTLDFVSRDGHITVLAFIPDPPNHQPIYDAAPTCAAVTPGGDVFVGTESNSLWRWNGSKLTRVLLGGKVGQVIGCLSDSKGNLYLANLSSMVSGSFPEFNIKPFDGSVIKVDRKLRTSYVARGLNYPTGMTQGPDGDVYVAVNGLCPSDLSQLNSDNSPPDACPEPGKVIRIDLPGGGASRGSEHDQEGR